MITINSNKRHQSQGCFYIAGNADHLTVQGEPVVTLAEIVAVRCPDCGEALVSVDARVDFSEVPENLHSLFLQMLANIPSYRLGGSHPNCPAREARETVRREREETERQERRKFRQLNWWKKAMYYLRYLWTMPSKYF